MRRATWLFGIAAVVDDISIHALLAESDRGLLSHIRVQVQFLSTLSLRRATHNLRNQRQEHQDFYPRSPCGERLLHRYTAQGRKVISIHALLAESDAYTMTTTIYIALFLSTLSLRRATRLLCYMILPRSYFYPRSPCGERPYTMTTTIYIALFLSTLSLRRATLLRIGLLLFPRYFYPRSPCGERQQKCTKQWSTFAHMKQIL